MFTDVHGEAIHPLQAEAARRFAELIADPASTGTTRWKTRKKTV